MGCLIDGLVELMGWVVVDVLQSGAQRLLVLLGLIPDPRELPRGPDGGDESA